MFPSPSSPYLLCPLSELCLDHVLATGQVFRWRKHHNISTHNQSENVSNQNKEQSLNQNTDCKSDLANSTWVGVIKHKLWLLHQAPDRIHYQCHPLLDKHGAPHPQHSALSPAEELSSYFFLHHSLDTMSTPWLSDPHLSSLLIQHQGLRIICQEPWECLVTFITSSCNNIPRISSLMMKISTLSQYSLLFNGERHCALPSVQDLSGDQMEGVLRELGFGYRAKYIASAAQHLMQCGAEEWLEGLRKVPLSEARSSLVQLAGVGPKVASCVCLMSLCKHQAVPIDTHIHQVAIKYYKSPSTKTLTPAMHSKIEQFFQTRHGGYAGWAQAYLFYSNSKKPDKQSNDNLASQASVKVEQENGASVENGTVGVRSSKKRHVIGVKSKGNKKAAKVENENIVKSVVKKRKPSRLAPSRVSCRTRNRVDYSEGKTE